MDVAGRSESVAALREATNRLVRTVDELSAETLAGPSLLPGWSRAHVVAHLALNAEALDAAVRGVVAGEQASMYASDEARDSDIDELAAAEPSVLRERVLGASGGLTETLDALPPETETAVVSRSPGSERTFPVGEVPFQREREVEIHHADLAAGYSYADWPGDFAGRVVDSLVGRPHGTAFVVHATDLDRTWPVGTGQSGSGEQGPTVSGTAAALGWWLSGRGAGEDLSCDGEMPQLPAW